MCCISVIVPVYNSEKTLTRCVDSILSQTFSDFELLLVDDGSTDSSGKMCDDYVLQDNRVYVFHKRNGGVSSARNVGLDNAKGKWVTFCDSDDYVDDNWLSIFMKHCKGGIDMVVQPFNVSNLNECKFFEGGCSDFIEIFYDLSIIGYTGNKILLLSILDKYNIRYNEAFSFHEDEVFAYQYLLHINKVIFTPEYAYHYDMPDFSIKYDGDNFEPHYVVFNIIKQINLQYPIPSAYQFYIKILRRSLFDSFLKRDSSRMNKLLRYQQIISENSKILDSFPFVWRMIFECPYHIAYIMLSLLACIRRII